MARDRDGALVMHEDGFPIDRVLKGLYLGVNNKTVLKDKFGIMFYEDISEEDRTKLTYKKSKEIFEYSSNDERFTPEDIIQHRHYVIQQLYRITAEYMKIHPDSEGVKDMCASMNIYYPLMKDIGMEEITPKYTVIHARTQGDFILYLEKANRLFGVDKRVGIEYPPDLVKTILNPLGMLNNSIYMIIDAKQDNNANHISLPSMVEELMNDPIIGPSFDLVTPHFSTLTGDLMLAILSTVFIGNPTSTFSQYIVRVRYALGIGNSYLFSKRNENDNNKWETFCHDEECFYTFGKKMA